MLFLAILACVPTVPAPVDDTPSIPTGTEDDTPTLLGLSTVQDGIDLLLGFEVDPPVTAELPVELVWDTGPVDQFTLPFVDGRAGARVPFADPCAAVDGGSVHVVARVSPTSAVDTRAPLEGVTADASAGDPVEIGDGLTVVCNIPQGVEIPLALTGARSYTFGVPVGRGLVLRHDPRGPNGVSFVGEAELELDPSTPTTLTVRGDSIATVHP